MTMQRRLWLRMGTEGGQIFTLDDILAWLLAHLVGNYSRQVMHCVEIFSSKSEHIRARVSEPSTMKRA